MLEELCGLQRLRQEAWDSEKKEGERRMKVGEGTHPFSAHHRLLCGLVL